MAVAEWKYDEIARLVGMYRREALKDAGGRKALRLYDDLRRMVRDVYLEEMACRSS